MKFKELFYESDLSVGDEVVYNKQQYVIKSVDGDKLELIDTSKTRGDTITVDKSDIHVSQLGIPVIGGKRTPKFSKRKVRSDIGKTREKADASQLSLFS